MTRRLYAVSAADAKQQCLPNSVYGWDWGHVQTGQNLDWYDYALCLKSLWDVPGHER